MILERSRLEAWLPKSILALRAYDRPTFAADLVAGITVGLVALPLALAFAISSGVPPQAGIWTAVVAGFLISALGGSRCQIGGPTGAFVVVISGIVAAHGVDGLYLCTLMAGVMILLLGVTGLGTAVKFIPRPVVIGFTNGIAVLIASTQIKDFLGLDVPHPSGVFLPRLIEAAHALPTLSPWSTAFGITSLALLILGRRFLPRVPWPIVALVLGTTAVALFAIPIATIGSRFGGLPSGLPTVRIPTFRPELVHVLLAPALTVAMLGAIESLLSATVADRMSGDRHNPNVELIAQGLANIVTPLVGGIPATGAIARTATNVRSGAKTPIAGIIHALTIAVVVLVAAPLAFHVPLAVLSAILFVVAWNMGEWAEIGKILKLNRSDKSVWLVTFSLTVFADLTVAVQAGMTLAALLFIRKVALTTSINRVTAEEIDSGRAHILQDKDIPEGVAVFRIDGPFLFGTTDKLLEITHRMDRLPPVVILRVRHVTALDATGIQAIEDLADRLHEAGHELVLCGARGQPRRFMISAGLGRHMGEANLCPSIEAALARARDLLADKSSRSA
jgi:sulfate permease, SulP family